jgi:hypothetical protein
MSLENKIEENTQAINRLIEVLENKKLAVDNEQSPDNNTTMEDVQQTLIHLSEKYGKDPAKDILSQFGAKKMSDLDPKYYQPVINAANDFSNREAT